MKAQAWRKVLGLTNAVLVLGILGAGGWWFTKVRPASGDAAKPPTWIKPSFEVYQSDVKGARGKLIWPVDDKAIKARPADITAVTKAYLDGMAYMKAKPDEAAKIIGKFMGVTAKEVKEQLGGVYNIPLAEMPKAFVKAKETTPMLPVCCACPRSNSRSMKPGRTSRLRSRKRSPIS